jgi:hypothetical protein
MRCRVKGHGSGVRGHDKALALPTRNRHPLFDIRSCVLSSCPMTHAPLLNTC